MFYKDVRIRDVLILCLPICVPELLASSTSNEKHVKRIFLILKQLSTFFVFVVVIAKTPAKENTKGKLLKDDVLMVASNFHYCKCIAAHFLSFAL